MKKDNEILLDTYVLQQDMRIRLPKQILKNLDVIKGVTMFDIYMNVESKEIILRISNADKGGKNDAK